MLLPQEPGTLNAIDNFWVKREWEKKDLTNPYVKFIHTISDELTKSSGQTYRLAYMNLNKRGGFGACNMARVGHYVKLYKAYIKKEIELIKPDLIICGGTYDTVIKYFPDLRDKCRNYYHPCYRIEENTSKVGL